MSPEPIQRILVIGTQRVAGWNLASRWGQRYDVVAHENDLCGDAEAVIKAAEADLVVYCGPGSEPSWSPRAADELDHKAVASAAAWADAAGDRFVAVMSDAVFTGPYMFHAEGCDYVCRSAEANVLAEIESTIQDCNDTALIVRTHVFGSSPDGSSLVDQILSESIVEVGGGGHASPILGADLADLIECAVVEQASGVMHIAGAERVSAPAFAERLLEAFDRPRREITLAIGDHASGFANGDRALVCREAKLQLGLSMPLLTDAFARLRAAMENAAPCELKAAA